MAGLGFTLLESVFLGGKTTSVIGMATSTLISAITTTTSGILSGIKYLSQHRDQSKELIDELNRTDLEATVTVIGLLVMELDEKSKKDQLSDSLLKGLELLHSVMNDIHLLLKEITESIEDHKHKWFSSWRSFNTESFVDKIREKNNVLLKRYGLVLDILKIK